MSDMPPPLPASAWKDRAFAFYDQHEMRVNLGFFLGGFLFDVVTLSSIDDFFSIFQQVVYLVLVGSLLFAEFLVSAQVWAVPQWLHKPWEYRSAIVHFLLGSLLSIYSLFFLKSASVFSSLIFVGLIMGIMVANEMKRVQSRGDTKIGLFVVCLFSFFSMLIPVALGFVGWIPFLLALSATGVTLWGIYRLLQRQVKDERLLRRHLILPGASVSGLFLLFYLLGWIPPVPLAVEEMGIYHGIEKRDGSYFLSHENPWYKPWNHGDQDFAARPGDRIHVFTKVFSPARFDDQVILHWQRFDVNNGWVTTDKIPMRVTGGRVGGYRGHASKGSFTEGAGRVAVETTDGREVGRISFNITLSNDTTARQFKVEER
jgi:uncharacterized membrane protein